MTRACMLGASEDRPTVLMLARKLHLSHDHDTLVTTAVSRPTALSLPRSFFFRLGMLGCWRGRPRWRQRRGSATSSLASAAALPSCGQAAFDVGCGGHVGLSIGAGSCSVLAASAPLLVRCSCSRPNFSPYIFWILTVFHIFIFSSRSRFLFLKINYVRCFQVGQKFHNKNLLLLLKNDIFILIL